MADSKREQAWRRKNAERGSQWAKDRMPTFIARLNSDNGGLGWGAHYHVDMCDLLAGYDAAIAAEQASRERTEQLEAALRACMAAAIPQVGANDDRRWERAFEQAKAALGDGSTNG